VRKVDLEEASDSKIRCPIFCAMDQNLDSLYISFSRKLDYINEESEWGGILGFLNSLVSEPFKVLLKKIFEAPIARRI
jgi:hypothetical protein